MFAFVAKRMGYIVAVLDPSLDCPTSQVSDIHIHGDLYDVNAIRKLSDVSDVLTYEFEHVNADVLCTLEVEGVDIRPSGQTLKLIQNKFIQKSLFKQNNLPVPQFFKVCNLHEVKEASQILGFPMMLKSCTGGYDGKGNFVVRNEKDIELAWETLFKGENEIMVEEFIAFEREISIVAGRSISGNIELYPIAENTHEDNILIMTKVPALLDEAVQKKANNIVLKIIDVLNDVGVFCVELFLTSNGDIYINEVAPRTHNSGHYSIEGCETSQFEQHLRAVVGLPLGSTKLLRPAVMLNILGQKKYVNTFSIRNLDEVLQIDNVYFHFYGKKTIDFNKKIGHITALADSVDFAEKKAKEALSKLDIIDSLI